MVSTKTVSRPGQNIFLLIISRNHSNMFLIEQQKKDLSKEK